MAKIEGLVYGTSKNGIPYARFGSGAKIMCIFAGGPGNVIPKGMELKFMVKPFLRFTNEYMVYYLTRRINMPAGHSTRDMADDYAQMIRLELGGRVDAAIGVSYGGMVAQYFAADHADVFNRLVIVVAAHTMSERGKQIDYDFARYLSEGKKRKASAVITDAIVENGFFRVIMKSFSWLLGGLLFKDAHPEFKKDVMVEAEAEVNHDSLDRLKDIQVPVLFICGSKDVYFTNEAVKKSAALIKRAELIIYAGKGHAGVLQDKRLPDDINRFINGR